MSLQFPNGVICEGCSHYRESRPHSSDKDGVVTHIACEMHRGPTEVRRACVKFKSITPALVSKAA